MINNTVILGVTKTTSLIFDEEFPELRKIEVEPYAISYSKFLPLPLKLLLDSGRILNVIKKEKLQLANYIKEFGINVVISDNRFGLSNPEVECIYITHQLNIQAGLFSGLANKIHHRYIKQFNEVWAPDLENENERLAGNLSGSRSLKRVKYIGVLSRLEVQEQKTEPFDYLCLLSGPEPQRTVLEKIMMQQAIGSEKKMVLVRGTKEKQGFVVPENVRIIDLPDAKVLSQLIQAADTVICRSGYSTLMDLKQLQKKKFIFIPTPGQAEQAYLADHWKRNFKAEVISQDAMKYFSF